MILGGGVIGLSAARELAGRGQRVTVVERAAISGDMQSVGAATWASLGVLTAPTSGRSPFQRLQSWGHRSYPALAAELESETGISIGYQVRGSLHLKEALPPAATRARVERLYKDAGLVATWVDGAALRSLVPGIFDGAPLPFLGALHVPSEAVVHPPALAAALRASCLARGVTLLEKVGEGRLVGNGEAVVELEDGRRLSAGTVLVAAGSWSRLASLSPRFAGLPVRPIRGQAIEVPYPWDQAPNLRFETAGLRREYHIIAKGGGRAWIGSTVEDAGFDPQVTGDGLQELLGAARVVLPELSAEEILRSWAGLRPQALRPGGPLLGKLESWSNVWVAAGHYRSGIMTGPVSARLLVHEMLGEPLPEAESGLDRTALAAFRVER